jgi:hypothetical protein
METRTLLDKSEGTESPLSAGMPRERLMALDALRGLTVAVMIMVNTSGDARHTFPILAHSRWNGCTLADVVFPCFLFMVGISSVFSVSSRLGRGLSRRTILAQAARRSAVLFLLGLMVNGFDGPSLHTLRVYGVLQRIAFCYLAGTAMLLWSRTRTIAAILYPSWLATGPCCVRTCARARCTSKYHPIPRSVREPPRLAGPASGAGCTSLPAYLLRSRRTPQFDLRDLQYAHGRIVGKMDSRETFIAAGTAWTFRCGLDLCVCGADLGAVVPLEQEAVDKLVCLVDRWT